MTSVEIAALNTNNRIQVLVDKITEELVDSNASRSAATSAAGASACRLPQGCTRTPRSSSSARV